MMHKINLKKGFTLLEALVATSILMMAVAAPITIAQKGLSSAIFTKNQMIASYLVQDVIEYIKNKRDEAIINSQLGSDPDWRDLWTSNDKFAECVMSASNLNGCQVDTLQLPISEAVTPYDPASSDSFLIKDTNDGFYGYFYNPDIIPKETTNFKRQVQIQLNNINGNLDEALITVTVSWGTTNDSKMVVQSLIYNN